MWGHVFHPIFKLAVVVVVVVGGGGGGEEGSKQNAIVEIYPQNEEIYFLRWV